MELNREMAVTLRGRYRDEIGPGITQSQDIVQRAMRQMAAAISVTAVIYGLQRMVKAASEFADTMSKAAQIYGSTAEQLSVLKYMADLSGSSFEELGVAMKLMSVRMTEAASGSREAQALFQQLNVSALDSAGRMKSTNQMLEELADRFAAMPDGAQKTALAVEMFGRSGAQLIPLLNQGSAGIRRMHDETVAFGLVVSSQFGKQAEEFNDNLRRMQLLGEGISLNIAQALIPSINELMSAFLETWKQVGPEFLDNVRLGFVGVANSIRLVTGAAEDGGGVIQFLGRLLASIPLAISGTFHAAYMAIAWIFEKLAAVGGAIDKLLFGGQDKYFENLTRAFERRKETALENLEEMRRSLATIWSDSNKNPDLLGQDAGKVPGGSRGPSDRNREIEAQRQLNEIILSAKRERMDAEERMLFDHNRKVAAVLDMEKVQQADKDEAIYQLTLSYNQKLHDLRQQSADAAEQQWRDVRKRIESEENKAVDAFAQAMLEKVRNLNAEVSRAFQQQSTILELEGEVRIARIELDQSIPDQLRAALIGLERAQLDVQAAQRDLMWAEMTGDADAAAQAVLRLQAAFLRLQGAQAGVSRAQKQVHAESKTVTNAMKVFGSAVEQAFVASAQAAMMSGQNMRKAIADQLQAIGVQEAILAVVELAKYFASLWLNPAEAAAHLAASKLHLVAAAMIGAAGAAAGIGAGGGGTGGGGGGNGQNYGPREYTSEDIARIRAQGRGDTATGAGESAADAQRPIVVNHFHNKILTPDVANTKRWFDKHQAIFTRGAAVEMARNPAVAKAIGQLATRER